MLRFARRLSEEHGQSLILLVMCITVMFVIGAIVVDVGLWLSERRGSQTDADFSALAGAYELLNPGASSSDAVTAAGSSLAANNQQGNASFADPVVVDNSCFNTSKNDAVSVDVRHDSHALFSGIFGIVNPDIGAHAKACVGAAEAPGNIVPFEISESQVPCFANSKPNIGALCPIEGGSHTSNPRGMLDLNAAPACSQNGGPPDIANLIKSGALGTCLINTTGTCDPKGPWYDCVAVQTGNQKAVIDGTHARVTQPALCDQNYPIGPPNGIDDFAETVVLVFNSSDPSKIRYAPRDCDPTKDGIQMSPRLVTLIVLQTAPDPGPTGLPIIAFAGFYIAGCVDESMTVTNDTVFSRSQADCNANGVRQLSPATNESDLYVSAAQPGPAAATKPLVVKTLVVGGVKQPSDFTMTVTSPGNLVAPFPGSAAGVTVQLLSGSSYNVTESVVPGYVQVYSNCSNNNIGNGATCTVTNTFIAPTPSPTPTPTPSLTPSPTSTPGPPTPTPTPNPNGDCGPSGTCVVYGRFVNIIFAGAAVGLPTDQTTLFGIALKE